MWTWSRSLKKLLRSVVLIGCFLAFILFTKKLSPITLWELIRENHILTGRYKNNTAYEKDRALPKQSHERDGSVALTTLKSQISISPKNEINEQMRVEKIDKMIERLRFENFYPPTFWNTSLTQLTRQLGGRTRRTAKTLTGYANYTNKNNLPSWKLLHMNIRQYSLYDPDDPSVEITLRDMANLRIISAETTKSGTEFKLIFKFSNGGQAMMKPMRYSREVEADENRYIFDDMERHVAEIAAFQLDKLLGFYRVPPTVGRRINITSELKPISPTSVTDTIFTSPAGNLCFYGKCKKFCDHAHAFCGHPDTIEISLQSFLPPENTARRKSWSQPWRRSYSKKRKAYWETNDDMCQFIRNETPYNNSKLLKDIIDVHTFDFLTGNKDRHNIAIFEEFGDYSFPILYDNGRGFGRQTYDAMSILAPLRQCCLIRKSTLLKYIKLYMGPERLSSLMEKALESDPLAPVLIQGHLNALDRRLVKILQAVELCLATYAFDDVIVSDDF
ncbi:extracellular serine/threonine protein kinase FAM20C-like [Mercenaria mercenaria]|uniref:extracellular serine/threonine protein kinase FAM20C-like n=1 Tax=Mercenaria mercenaria TaxID=6596 RepID=UPI00234FB432|nr:extracellular serine/threonine protein kinase FAM20C-like [Mercenaria mercenaria]